MANYTVAQIQALVKRAARNRDDVDDEILQAMDAAQLKMAALRGASHKNLEKIATFNTVASTRRYDLSTICGSADHSACMGVFNPLRDTTSKRPIRWRSAPYFDELDQSGTGAPLMFTHWAQQLELHPTPDGVYAVQVRYRVRPTRFSTLDTTDSSGMAEEYDWPIIWFAAATINAVLGSFDRAQVYEKFAVDYLSGLIDSTELEDEYVDFALGVSTQQ